MFFMVLFPLSLTRHQRIIPVLLLSGARGPSCTRNMTGSRCALPVRHCVSLLHYRDTDAPPSRQFYQHAVQPLFHQQHGQRKVVRAAAHTSVSLRPRTRASSTKSNTPWTATFFPYVWPISTQVHHQPWTEIRQEKNKIDSNHDRTPMQNPPACPVLHADAKPTSMPSTY